jgi:hypothetical protein
VWDVSGIRNKLRSRLLSTDFEAWNDPRRAKSLLPVFVVVGGALGTLVRSYGVLEQVPLPVLWTTVAILGVTVLAVVD